jgi:DNA-binding transcriptional ArsR family regulator
MKVAARKVIKEAGKKDYHILIKIVRQNPGIHFRELLRASGLGNGTLEYQLARLERLGLLKAYRSGGFTRYYNSDVSKTDMELLYYLKQRTCREIIQLLLRGGGDDTKNGSLFFTFQKIVQMIGRAPSNVSVQLGRLIEHKVVSFNEKKHGYYIVNNKQQAIKRLLSKYKG